MFESLNSWCFASQALFSCVIFSRFYQNCFANMSLWLKMQHKLNTAWTCWCDNGVYASGFSGIIYFETDSHCSKQSPIVIISNNKTLNETLIKQNSGQCLIYEGWITFFVLLGILGADCAWRSGTKHLRQVAQTGIPSGLKGDDVIVFIATAAAPSLDRFNSQTLIFIGELKVGDSAKSHKKTMNMWLLY